MATDYPTSIDSLTNPTSTDTMAAVSHSGQHTNANDAIEALQAKVGADSSAVTTSHDYKLSGVSGSDVAASVTGTETLTNKTLEDATALESSAAPTTDAMVANKKYVDDQVSGVNEFTELTDTPANYTSQANKIPQVNAGETALEFTDAPTIANTNITEATDKNYVTDAQQTVIGNTSGTNSGDDPADDTAYNATSWDANTDSATKNAIRDKVDAMDTAIGLNTAKSTNISTDLSEGTATETTVDVNSSDGNNATLASASTSRAGLLTKAKWDEVVANTAKNTNVPTALSVGTVGVNTVAITSDGGADDVTLPAALVSAAGMLTTAKWGEIVANNAKLTADTTNVTSAGALMDSELASIADVKALNQSVVSGATPTFTNTNFTEATNKNYVTDAQQTVITNTSNTNTGDEVAASTSTAGVAELTIASEVTTGTDTTRTITADSLAGSDYGKRVVGIQVIDVATDTAVADDNAYFRVPSVMNGWNLVGVAANVATAGTTGTTDVQIYNVTQTADMLSTVITIDSAETDSSTAATAAVIDTANDDVATGDRIRIDIDAVSSTPAKGLYCELIFQLP
jgi:hypothetical protein